MEDTTETALQATIIDTFDIKQIEVLEETTVPETVLMDSLEAAKVDTQAIFERIDRNSAELNDAKFQLAELLYFQMNDSDSSKLILHSLAQSAGVRTASKSLFLLSHIAKNEGDVAAEDSLNKILVEKYTNTPYAQKAAQRLGVRLSQAFVDSAKVLFLQAEESYFKDKIPEKALSEYSLIDSLFPDSPYAPKAMFAQAFIYHTEMGKDSLALEIYRELAEKYPEDTLAIIAKRRSQVSKKEAEKKNPAFQDTLIGLASGDEEPFYSEDVDFPPVCKKDSAQISQFILENNYFPQRALSAQTNGKVVLELTVDIYGYPHDIEVIKEVPIGYGFADQALMVVRELTYTPGRMGDRPVPVRIEQEIYFKK